MARRTTNATAKAMTMVMRVASRNESCWLQLPAIPVAGRTVRLHLRYWLQRLGWPFWRAQEIECAVNEAIDNAVEHGHPIDGTNPIATVIAGVEALPGGMRRVRVRVSDNHRRWPIPSDPHDNCLRLRLMNGLMDQVQIIEGDGVETGTDVVLVSRPVPAAR
jgi:anti-sigma regulatory factor (Ser/Thr protein kinase)